MANLDFFDSFFRSVDNFGFLIDGVYGIDYDVLSLFISFLKEL
jgi:hypothetical protein